MGKLFKVDEDAYIVCETGKTRNGFKHTATLYLHGADVDASRCFYINRTWERFQYQSVLMKLIEKNTDLTEQQRETFRGSIQ